VGAAAYLIRYGAGGDREESGDRVGEGGSVVCGGERKGVAFSLESRMK
jgi:hypothetical protein